MKNLIKSHARIAALLCSTILVGAGTAKADQVFADDVIVQGSLCVGLDCVNGESFGFDTIILKENNTRILFNDTSTSAGFPANDWRLVANDSGSGGGNLFAIEDATAGRQIFTVTAGAPVASLFVDSTGRVGLRNSAPLLDLHMTTGNTPAIRLEQTNASGFTAQTWDVAGNEANFFVRDLTGGSKLPFRIRPGAPTSSIDINSAGNVGIGNQSPAQKLSLAGAAGDGTLKIGMSNTTAGTGRLWTLNSFSNGSFFIADDTAAANRLAIDNTGNVGIGTLFPGAQLHTTGSVRFAGVAGCTSGIQSNGSGTLSCLASSRRFKDVAGDLPPSVALANIMALRPQTGSFKDTPDVPEHWLIAEEVATIDPALVGLHEGKPHVVKTQNVVADLIAVVQRQERRIDELEKRLSAK